MQSYAEESDYLNYYTVVPDNFERLAYKASRIIDTLTFNRIIASGFENLTDYQRETVTSCCCEIVQFYDENEGVLDGLLSSYSINGVTMQFDYSGVRIVRGCALRRSTYSRLISTGLCVGVIT